MQRALPELEALGARLVTISPQLPDNSLSMADKLDLTFEVLSDVGNRVAREFGLVYTLPAEMRSIYVDFGIDLPAANGDQSFELPVPATYVIDRSGIIRLAFVDIDYTKRLDPEEILAALTKL